MERTSPKYILKCTFASTAHVRVPKGSGVHPRICSSCCDAPRTLTPPCRPKCVRAPGTMLHTLRKHRHNGNSNTNFITSNPGLHWCSKFPCQSHLIGALLSDRFVLLVHVGPTILHKLRKHRLKENTTRNFTTSNLGLH